MRQRNVLELMNHLAGRESLFKGRSAGERYEAALPDLNEEDREELLRDLIKFFFMGPGSTKDNVAQICDSFLYGIEIGREMERWSSSQEVGK